jgi:hypothetical protein
LNKKIENLEREKLLITNQDSKQNKEKVKIAMKELEN